MEATLEGTALGQSPRQPTQSSPQAIRPATLPILFTEKTLRAALAGVSERKFKELRAAGIVPDPLMLGARCPRWTLDDYHEILRRLPRRQRQPEPARLTEARALLRARQKAEA